MNLLEFTEALPDDPRFKPCAGCGESYMGLPPSGLCSACQREQEAAESAPEKNRDLTLHMAGVPERYRVEFIDPDPWPKDSKSGLSLNDWKGEPWSVLMTGNVGTGKTMLAVELLFRFACAGYSTRFLKAAHLPHLWFDRGGDRAPLIQVGLLVVDELGRGHVGNAWEAVSEVLTDRYDAMRPTIVTTNMSLQDLAAGDEDLRRPSQIHVADRLTDGLVVTCRGDSRRGQ